MKRNNVARIAIVSAFAVVPFSGCSMYQSAVNYIRSDSAATCPDAAILASTATLPAFDPAKGDDPSNVLYTISFNNVTTRCDYSKRDFTADTSLKLFFKATRPPGGEDAQYKVPYYVAVTNNGAIQDKQVHWLAFSFSKGDSVVSGEDDVDSTVVRVDRAKKPYEYHVIVGFQLTKAQLEYNKKMGQFEP
ncbi:MAG TPA: hypothetical protein VMU01_12365 [Rhizomicrobium sp.]|nr:hypothetical protein [Rhizomicrobium sp.]